MLKLDPKNTELLSQKQTILNKEIEETRNKLAILKDTKEETDKKMAEGTKINEENYRALQREIINTESKLKQLQLAEDPFYKFGKNAEELGNKISNVSSKIDNLSSKLTTRLTLPVAGIATAGIAYNAQIEKYTKSFETFLGDAEEAGKVVNKIKEDASKTPFDTANLIQANQMLISTNENADNAREVILALGDAVTATGGGNAELTRMAANLQQIKNAGQATALDIKQFAYAGIDIYGLLAAYTGKTVAEVKDMTVSYEVLTEALKSASKQGGKYYNAMNDASETLTGQTNQLTAEVKSMSGELTKGLMPVAKKVVGKAKELIQKFNSLSDSEKENIVRIGLMVAAAGPLLKILGTTGKVIGTTVKGVGIFTQAVGVMTTKTESGTKSVDNLAKILKGLTSPAGIAAVGITAAVGIILIEMKKAEEQTRKAYEGMGRAASEYIQGIESAESYLGSFNSTLFASSEEQQKLQENMDEVQAGITAICKKASDERRDYTQEEIKQLDEYFTKLKELKDREIEIQMQVSGAITQQAKSNSENFSGSLEEYKVLSQKWIKTAKEQAKSTIDLIEEGAIQEIALLNQKYSTEESRQSEAYQAELKNINDRKQEKIQLAQQEVAEVTSAYSSEYTQKLQADTEYLNSTKDLNEKMKAEKQKLKDELVSISEDLLKSEEQKRAAAQEALLKYQLKTGDIWKEYAKNMDEAQAEQLGTWLAMQVDTEVKGGEISKETKELVDALIESYDTLPQKTRESMKNAMTPMLEEMEKSEPQLYAKASGIAGGILSNLKKAFDIHSPSKKTRKIFQYVGEGELLGLQDTEKKIYDEVDKINKNIVGRLNGIDTNVNMGALQQSVIDKTRTIFTTPNIVINANDELTASKINTIIDTLNRRLGSQY